MSSIEYDELFEGLECLFKTDNSLDCHCSLLNCECVSRVTDNVLQSLESIRLDVELLIGELLNCEETPPESFAEDEVIIVQEKTNVITTPSQVNAYWQEVRRKLNSYDRKVKEALLR